MPVGLPADAATRANTVPGSYLRRASDPVGDLRDAGPALQRWRSNTVGWLLIIGGLFGLIAVISVARRTRLLVETPHPCSISSPV